MDVRKPYAICASGFVDVRKPYAICTSGFVRKPYARCTSGFVDVQTFHELILLHRLWTFYARLDAPNVIRSSAIRNMRFREQRPMRFRVGPLGP